MSAALRHRLAAAQGPQLWIDQLGYQLGYDTVAAAEVRRGQDLRQLLLILALLPDPHDPTDHPGPRDAHPVEAQAARIALSHAVPIWVIARLLGRTVEATRTLIRSDEILRPDQEVWVALEAAEAARGRVT